MLLLGSASKPCQSKRAILRHPNAVAIHAAESELGIDLALFGCTREPMRCASVVLRHTLAIRVHVPDKLLSVCVPLMRERLQDLARSDVVMDGVFHQPVQQLTCALLAVSW